MDEEKLQYFPAIPAALHWSSAENQTLVQFVLDFAEKVGKSGSYGYDGGPRESVTSKEAKGSSRGGCSELSTS